MVKWADYISPIRIYQTESFYVNKGKLFYMNYLENFHLQIKHW